MNPVHCCGCRDIENTTNIEANGQRALISAFKECVLKKIANTITLE